MIGFPSILLPFHNKFNKFYKIGAQMLDSIYHLTLKLLWNHVLWLENATILPYIRDVIDIIT